VHDRARGSSPTAVPSPPRPVHARPGTSPGHLNQHVDQLVHLGRLCGPRTDRGTESGVACHLPGPSPLPWPYEGDLHHLWSAGVVA